MRLLDEMIGVDPTLRTLKELLRERTGGNPLFIEESVRTVEQAGVLVGERGAYRLGRSQDPVVPETVQDILAMRIDRLEPAEKRLLQAAAVIGYDVDAELLRQLVRVAEEDFELQLGRLNMAGLLCEVSHLPRRMYVFGHALTHDVAYSTLLNDLRRRFHWEIVELIEDMNPDSLGLHADVLSHHAIHGARWDKAVEYSRMAGLKALSQSASQLAVAAFERALEAIAELPSNRANHELAHDLRLDMRNALLSLGRNREILAHLGAAEQLALELADDRRLARTRSHLCHCHWILGEWSRSIETGRQALHAAEQLADYGVEVWTRFFMGLAFYSLGGYPDAIRLLTLNAKELTGDAARNRFGLVSHPAVASRGWLAWCLAETGEFDDALSHAEQALSIADEVGNPYDKVQALLGVGGARLLQGEFDKSIAPLESAAVLCDAAEIPILRPRVTATLGYAYALAGRGDDALGAAERASAEVATMHLGAMKAMCLRSVAEVLLLNGQYVAALESAERVLDYCLTSGERGLEAWTGHLVANALLERGAFDEAMAAIEHARDIAKDPGMRPLVCRL
jgi:tetratricopeptide (TPR) repeat protein